MLDRDQRVTLVCLLVAVAQLARFMDPVFVVDDAWISFRSARNLLEHGALTFDVSRPPVEGFTNLLWTLISAAWIAITPSGDPLPLTRLFGAALHLGCVALAGDVASRAAGGSLVSRGVAGGLIALSGSMAYYAMSGLETPLWAFLYLLALWGLQRAGVSGRGGGWVGLTLALAAATRPEGVLVGILFCAAAIGWPAWRPLARTLVPVFVIGVAAMEGWRLWTYGALVPNTFHAKPPNPGLGWTYLGDYLVWGLGVVGALAAAVSPRRAPIAGLALLISAALGAGVIWSGGDWMPGWRRLTLVHAGLVVAAGIGAGLSGARLAPRALAVGVWACALVGAATTSRDSGAFNPYLYRMLGEMCERTPGVTDVALIDIGSFGWHYNGAIYDLVGLTDRRIAALEGTHGEKPWDAEYFAQRSPELIMVSNEREPMTGPAPRLGDHHAMRAAVALDYSFHMSARISADSYLMIFRRPDLELPPEIWGEPEAAPAWLRADGW